MVDKRKTNPTLKYVGWFKDIQKSTAQVDKQQNSRQFTHFQKRQADRENSQKQLEVPQKVRPLLNKSTIKRVEMESDLDEEKNLPTDSPHSRP